ncbi:hypothetical protein C9F11_42850 (plasmid) [Streptomyces sp. YIM 121038]|uniref:hypothetical protein n=1 Tax=Streptomyces sp. YIM 121038 TaxID=2136401 RepID=UPI00111023B7|nr:hypothetical protein [Streptomyces sp. YIM 121038]QCX82150.1 hypothetical protein C9F11_42850 [Streptomyces sp. YIM 121038]
MKRRDLPNRTKDPVAFVAAYSIWYAQWYLAFGLLIPAPLCLGALTAIALPGDAGTVRITIGLLVCFAPLWLSVALAPRLVDRLDRHYESQGR